jgi:hypothetical protein
VGSGPAGGRLRRGDGDAEARESGKEVGESTLATPLESFQFLLFLQFAPSYSVDLFFWRATLPACQFMFVPYPFLRSFWVVRFIPQGQMQINFDDFFLPLQLQIDFDIIAMMYSRLVT